MRGRERDFSLIEGFYDFVDEGGGVFPEGV